ncbi:hypothetical protein HUT18_11790 [Streptomyces sp. NA04227]|uniref:hypothetical protein n=1 Tax=Streptomyces sp. NA04227 TaxID=2742136 RepID=UPI001592153E|nr:hypothetical protein [Streptomyces sp. NA04227]QKW06980.1 hypothetical protein HUT18_11790 [Streptomyces sp. NA04227]
MPAPVAVPFPVPPLAQPELDDEPELADDEDQDDVGEEDPEQRRRALALPDLSPYYDVRPLKELGPLAVAAGRRGGPPLLRGLARAGHGAIIGVLCLLRGGRLLLVLLYAWATGSIGKGGSIPARLGITAAFGYVLATAPAQHPAAPGAVAAALFLLLIAAGTGRIPEPGGKKKGNKAGEKSEKVTGEKGQKIRKPGEKPKGGDNPEEAPAKVEKASKENSKDTPSGGVLGRLKRLGKTHETTSAADLAKAPESSPEGPADDPAEESTEGADEKSTEGADETPAGPSRNDVIHALHRLVGEGRGVLLTTLRQHLSLADTRAVRRVLGEAHIAIRTGVRAEAGNGPGVHRDDFPPLPPTQGSPQGSGVVAGESANANANNATNAPEEGAHTPDDVWTGEEIAKGYRYVQDTERGPSAWKIEHHGG